MAKTTFGEEIYLRALTGRIVGEHMLAEYSKVAFLSPKNIICAAISAAAEAAYIQASAAQAAHFIVEPGREAEVAQAVAEFEPEAIVLMFGGETPLEETKRLFVATLKALAGTEVMADVVVHVRIFAVGGLQLARQDEAVREYLDNTEVFAYTADLEKGLFIYNIIYFGAEPEAVEAVPLTAFPVTLEHAELLNRSLRDKTLQWVDKA